VVNVYSEAPPVPYGTGNPKRLFQTVAGLPGVNKVLDLGCNAACWSPIFQGKEYYGVDQNLEIFERSRENAPHGVFVRGCGENIPFDTGTFDLVFTSHVLQHNDHFPEKDCIVREIARVLRPGGYYLMVESTASSDEVRPTDQTFDVTGWKNFIVDRGFEFQAHWEPEEYLFVRE
jgi:SAM-dependent methyltransferase